MVRITEDMGIIIQRGDYARFPIIFSGKDAPKNDEEVLFTVKKNSEYKKPILEKLLKVENDRVWIELTNFDTKNLDFGDYEWDIRFPNLYFDGEPFTPMDPCEFQVAEVIGNV